MKKKLNRDNVRKWSFRIRISVNVALLILFLVFCITKAEGWLISTTAISVGPINIIMMAVDDVMTKMCDS